MLLIFANLPEELETTFNIIDWVSDNEVISISCCGGLLLVIVGVGVYIKKKN